MKRILIAFMIAFLMPAIANAQWLRGWRYVAPSPCANGQCPTPATKQEPKREETKEPEHTTEEIPEVETTPPAETLSVSRSRFSAPSLEIADACDQILDRLEARYGKPRAWKPFPIFFRRYMGNGIAGYTQYGGGEVCEVVVYEPLENAVGGTLDHELTHAFFFYLLNSNFDLFLNEGLAQNSEYRRRESLRQTVYRRYSNGEFWELDRLYGRNSYDGGLLIYHEGFSVVDFLIARGGSLWITAFMNELVKTSDVDRTLFRYYGYKNLKELQTAWIDYIERGQDRQTVGAVR
ncbi:MAG: hypothetical protein IKX88_01100 [Thermoguttaceae bacterium]|nr:hypothetical protein [Thermoguttaceae bacterium]MBR5757175.1 hypothetical protein [Thermoguttaceae bacterium]